MKIEIFNKNLFESSDEGIILTIDGAAKGMEGNLARNFARLNPEAWEEIEYDIKYPIPLGTSKVFEIHPDIECKNKYCFIASTLNHLDTLTEGEKLKVQSSAFRQALSLAESNQISILATAVMVGGWRLEFEVALDNMLKTYLNAFSISSTVPALRIYIMASSEFQRAVNIIKEQFPSAVLDNTCIKIA